MGLNGLEPSTSRLSGVRSNQLSYKPLFGSYLKHRFYIQSVNSFVSAMFSFYSAATCFPTGLPLQYPRPGRS